MKVSVLVVDDEQLAREELCYLLSKDASVEVTGQADNGIAALDLLDDLEPDIVFLDVQMPGLTGFEVARQLAQRPRPPHVVFVTAFDQYALDAFTVNAVDYLLKPVEPARLEEALARARSRIDRARSGVVSPQALAEIVEAVAARQARRSPIVVKVDDRILLVQAEDLVYASLNEDEVTIVASQVTGTSNYRTLDELQAQLDQATFWRVHRSYLVNINKIKEIVPWFSRNFILRMRDAKSTEIPVSRAQTKRLRDYLQL
ncbi:DNA-binding response regulator [Luteitalea sp. TBR-22]|uniref:LytR/AlgR family response regulator transcription factor n=1 Tax=Luteitalea sp. TBR-22 TaxID=2802971 RepID=UPI001AF85328|nr:LytTR family DNA-binding domain-containing protein [Luteitalea sp. TBR-22]BCS32879.1 DNA-binding response regulator [Luteitalea sp. TBR-22]